MNFRRAIAALLVVPASLVALAVPAGAAVPKRAPEYTIACNDGSGKHASVWQRWPGSPYRLAAENPCRDWLVFGDCCGNYALAPGAHFNWAKHVVEHVEHVEHLSLSGCPYGGNPSDMDLIYRYDRVRPSPVVGCPSRTW